MNTQDNELLELCKEVYEKTGWGLPEGGEILDRYYRDALGGWKLVDYQYFSTAGMLNVMAKRGAAFPLYTSDYLLEKLPSSINIWKVNSNFYEVAATVNNLYETDADTPLKALLKLVLALKEAGELTTLNTKEAAHGN